MKKDDIAPSNPAPRKSNIFFPTHNSFLLGGSMVRPRPREIGSEHWKGTEDEKDKLRYLM
jgi:hypothetical protein